VTELEKTMKRLKNRIEELESRNFILAECFKSCQAENQKAMGGLAYYAEDKNWTADKERNIARVDRGRLAKQIIMEIWGVDCDRKTA
jgi:hypothetical protein